MPRQRAILGCLVAVLAVSGCGDSDSEGGAPKTEDPGRVHVHGLGVNPRDGALFVATHTGLFRAAPGESEARRVAGRYQDTMGFTVVGPDRFLGSGHPDGRENLPPFLGLIESRNAGESWRPVSLVGERDFHVLEASGKRIYGFGSDFETREAGFLASDDGGRSWDERTVPEPLVSLALHPDDPDRLVASGQAALYSSTDAGRAWRRIEGAPALLSWTARVAAVDGAGVVRAVAEPGKRWRVIGRTGGRPAALDSGPDGELYVALHDGTIKRSADGGASWRVRSRP